ncbi:hypothetical protein [Lacticaseibacillus suihuaensis]
MSPAVVPSDIAPDSALGVARELGNCGLREPIIEDRAVSFLSKLPSDIRRLVDDTKFASVPFLIEDGVTRIIESVVGFAGSTGASAVLDLGTDGLAVVPTTSFLTAAYAASNDALLTGIGELTGAATVLMSSRLPSDISHTSETISPTQPIGVTLKQKRALRVDYEVISKKIQIQDNLDSKFDVRLPESVRTSRDAIAEWLIENESALAKALGYKRDIKAWNKLLNRLWKAVQRM